LSDDELREVWNALGQDQFGDIVRLLVLTGQRLAEIGDLRWSEVDVAAGVLRLAPERVKNGRPHTVPLSAMARAIIEAQPRRLNRDLVFGRGQGGFAGWGHCKARLDQGIIDARKAVDPKAKPVGAWRLHDIRRTCATRLGDLGTQPHVVEAVLNHVSGSKSGIAGVYNRAPYEAEKRTALALWAEHVRSIVEQSKRKIVALRA
jgi:integrase